jgi:hypothetical protein
MNTNTIGGLLAYCDWLVEKGYAGATQIEPWKTAVKKVFGTVNGEDYESLSLADVDLDDYMRRFRVLAQQQYKAESITKYGQRVRNALDAHAYFLEHQRPPTFREVTKRQTGDEPVSMRTKSRSAAGPSRPSAVHAPESTPESEFFDFEFPLTTGRMVAMRLPKRMVNADVDRLCAVLRTLQTDAQPQIPRHAGEALAA